MTPEKAEILATCKNCGSPQITPECVFCTPLFLPVITPKPSHYINHCWNCGTIIDSAYCVKSSVPSMGYHCNKCGEDLTKWKRNMSLLPA